MSSSTDGEHHRDTDEAFREVSEGTAGFSQGTRFSSFPCLYINNVVITRLKIARLNFLFIPFFFGLFLGREEEIREGNREVLHGFGETVKHVSEEEGAAAARGTCIIS